MLAVRVGERGAPEDFVIPTYLFSLEQGVDLFAPSVPGAAGRVLEGLLTKTGDLFRGLPCHDGQDDETSKGCDQHRVPSDSSKF